MFLDILKRKKPITVGPTGSAPGELNKRSDTWRFIEVWADEQIQAARKKNDNTNLSEVQTAVLRGKIKAYRDLLDLPKDRKGILTRE